MRACTWRGYHLVGFGDFCGFVGAILLWVVIGFWVIRYHEVGFSLRQLWWLLIPIAVLVAGQVMEKIGWSLAERKQFHYDYDSNTVTWMEEGHHRVYPDSSQAGPTQPASPSPPTLT